MTRYGLIGFPLGHSFSKKYFTEKFENEGIQNHQYDLFELSDYKKLPQLIAENPDIRGLNVTIPHKQNVVALLDKLDAQSAGRIGAVNTIKIDTDGKTTGYNTDYYGFRQSLEDWLGNTAPAMQALVLGDGGAAKAVLAALDDLHLRYKIVSRGGSADPSARRISYEALRNSRITNGSQLIINASPVGTFPAVDDCPDIAYEQLTDQHFLYDLVYNPAETLFLKKGRAHGAAAHNGLKMLQLQAEKAWQIWNDPDC